MSYSPLEKKVNLKQDKTDENLKTIDKTITGAINENTTQLTEITQDIGDLSLLPTINKRNLVDAIIEVKIDNSDKVGDIKQFISPPDDTWLPCDGSTVSVAEYRELCEKYKVEVNSSVVGEIMTGNTIGARSHTFKSVIQFKNKLYTYTSANLIAYSDDNGATWKDATFQIVSPAYSSARVNNMFIFGDRLCLVYTYNKTVSYFCSTIDGVVWNEIRLASSSTKDPSVACGNGFIALQADNYISLTTDYTTFETISTVPITNSITFCEGYFYLLTRTAPVGTLYRSNDCRSWEKVSANVPHASYIPQYLGYCDGKLITIVDTTGDVYYLDSFNIVGVWKKIDGLGQINSLATAKYSEITKYQGVSFLLRQTGVDIQSLYYTDKNDYSQVWKYFGSSGGFSFIPSLSRILSFEKASTSGSEFKYADLYPATFVLPNLGGNSYIKAKSGVIL